MEITFDKRIYNVKDDEHMYEVIHIVKHPIKEFDKDTYNYYIYKETEDINSSGWVYFEPSDELEIKIKKFIKEYEHTR